MNETRERAEKDQRRSLALCALLSIFTTHAHTSTTRTRANALALCPLFLLLAPAAHPNTCTGHEWTRGETAHGSVLVVRSNGLRRCACVCALQVDDQLLQQEFAHADGKANRDPRKPHDNKDNKGKVDLDLAYLGFVAAATAPPPLVPRNDGRPTLSRSTTEHFKDCLDELKDLLKEKGLKNSTCRHCVALANHLALKDGRIDSLQDELAKTTLTLDKLTKNYSVLTELIDRTTRAKASHVTAIEQCADRLDADLKASLTRVPSVL